MIKNLLTFLPFILAMLFIFGVIDIKYINVFIVVSILAFVYKFINYAFKQDNINRDNSDNPNPKNIFTEEEYMHEIHASNKAGIPWM